MSLYISIVVKFEKIEGSELIKPIEWAIYDLLGEKMLPERYTLLGDAEEEIPILDKIARENENKAFEMMYTNKRNNNKYS